MQPVFDGHNDVLCRLWMNAKEGGDPVAEFLDGTASGHIDLPRARMGGLAGGLCAIFVPSGHLVLGTPVVEGHYETPLSEPVERAQALDAALEITAIAFRLNGPAAGRSAARHRISGRRWRADVSRRCCTWKVQVCADARYGYGAKSRTDRPAVGRTA